MVSLLAILPLLLTLLVSVGAVFYVLKRKSLAQSICVQQAARMQQDLKLPLKKLLHLNPKATSLRAQRVKADSSLLAATASGYPPAIAAAQAMRTAVIVQQTALGAQQIALLFEAQRLRDQGQRELRRRVAPLAAKAIQSRSFYFRPLAVEPKPPVDLSPNYETVAGFSTFQQHAFYFQVDLLAGFPAVEKLNINAIQPTNCSVTLQEKDDEWKIQILAAKAR